jgi:phosphoribosylanthranilate isomerase
MTWIKICGITSLEDAQTAVDAGADAVGFVFWEKSPRNIDPSKAREIVKQLPDGVEKVGVFVDHSVEALHTITKAVKLRTVQLHNHDGKDVAELSALKQRDPELRLILALAADRLLEGGGMFISQRLKESLYALLIDSGNKMLPGGTGKTFNWEQAQGLVRAAGWILPVIIAGGLASGNVGEAIRRFEPFGVDVSSGVERAPGKKDPEKIRAFVQAVHAADERLVLHGKTV